MFLSRFHIVLGSINSLKINFIFVFSERDGKNRMNDRIKKWSRHFLISFKDSEPGSNLLNDRIKKLSRHFLISFKDGEPGSHLLLSCNICVKEVAGKIFSSSELTSLLLSQSGYSESARTYIFQYYYYNIAYLYFVIQNWHTQKVQYTHNSRLLCVWEDTALFHFFSIVITTTNGEPQINFTLKVLINKVTHEEKENDSVLQLHKL